MSPKKVAMARLRKQIESLEQPEPDLLPVEAKTRQSGSKNTQFARPAPFSRRTDREAQK